LSVCYLLRDPNDEDGTSTSFSGNGLESAYWVWSDDQLSIIGRHGDERTVAIPMALIKVRSDQELKREEGM